MPAGTAEDFEREVWEAGVYPRITIETAGAILNRGSRELSCAVVCLTPSFSPCFYVSSWLTIRFSTMNFLTLNAGDAIYVPTDAPHAYLSGNIVECMARSNNVLNTGFCPHADRDSIKLFSAALTFSPHNADEVLLPSKLSSRGKNGKTVEYAPPMSEFNMLNVELGGRRFWEVLGGRACYLLRGERGR